MYPDRQFHIYADSMEEARLIFFSTPSAFRYGLGILSITCLP
jgi:hypothetical protein